MDAGTNIAALKTALAAAEVKASRAEAKATEAEARAAVATAKVSDAEAEIAFLKLTIEKLRREFFGQRSERKQRLLDQLELQLDELEASATEDELAAEKAAAETTQVKGFTRRRTGRKPLPAHLPRKRVVVSPPAACACCGSAKLSKIGEDITETLEAVPRQWKVIQTVREKFTCAPCKPSSPWDGRARRSRKGRGPRRRLRARRPAGRRPRGGKGRSCSGFAWRALVRSSVDASVLQTIGRREPGPEVAADLGRGYAHRVAGEMRIPRGRGHHPVAEQVADQRQPLAERQRAGGEPVP